MTELDEIRNISAGFDIRAETFAVNLLKQAAELNEEISLDHILMNPIGDRKRRISRDVAGVKKKFFQHDTVLQVNVNRKGLFDTLPERLFLNSDDIGNTPKKRTQAIERQIKEARKFFLPFEQAAYHAQIEIEQLEQKLTEQFPSFFESIWGLQNFSDYLSARQKSLLCHLLPEAYRAVGDWNLTGLIFEAVLQKPVNIGFSAPKELEIPFSDTGLSEMRLGENSVMGDSFRDEFPTLDITVKGITNDELEGYLPGGENQIILEELLCGYFIPLEIPYQIKIDVTTDSMGFTLGEMTLGYNIVFT